MDSNENCNVCKKEVQGAHVCVKCNLPVHLICGQGIGEEGYGQPVTCKTCLAATVMIDESIEDRGIHAHETEFHEIHADETEVNQQLEQHNQHN